MSFLVIGDELHFDGYLIGMLAQAGIPATVMDNAIEHLECATMPEEEDEPEPVAPTGSDPGDYDQALDDLTRAAGEYAKGGLLRMSDLANIVAQLKEETS